MNPLRRCPEGFQEAQRLAAGRSSCVLALLLCVGCANDVVLGEHVATTSTSESSPSTTAPFTTEPTETAAPSTMGASTRCPFPPFPDGGKPDDDNHRDEEYWRRDAGFDFEDCRFFDAGPRPPKNPDHPMDNDDTFETKPNVVGPRPGEVAPPGASALFDDSSNSEPTGGEPFSD